MKKIKTYIFWLVVFATGACQSTCTYCNKTPTPVEGKLIISGEIASDCNYFNLAANGQQNIKIVVSGQNNFSRSYNESNIPSNTYNIEVPSTSAFTITAEPTEIAAQSCSICVNQCPGGKGRPRWQGVENFTSAGAAGSSYNVTVKLGNPADNCLCFQ